MAEIEHPLVAIVGGDTLVAKEIRELLSHSPAAPRVQLISAAADGSAVLTGLLSEEQVDPVVMVPLVAEQLEGAKSRFWLARPHPAAGL